MRGTLEAGSSSSVLPPESCSGKSLKDARGPHIQVVDITDAVLIDVVMLMVAGVWRHQL